MENKRGRPRGFEREAALETALRLFWKQGFLGTSLTDLTEAMGLNKPSLYAAFGNKEALFLTALERYFTLYIAQTITALEAEPDARAAVRDFLMANAKLFADPEMPGGCFIVTNLCGDGGADVPEPIGDELTLAGQRTRAAMAARLARAKRENQLPADFDETALLEFLMLALLGAASAAKGGTAWPDLEVALDLAMRVWPEPALLA